MMFCFGKPKAVLVMGTETLLNRGSDGGNTLLPIFLFHFDISINILIHTSINISTNHIYQLAYHNSKN